MDNNSIIKITENAIMALKGEAFQDFCDRLCLKLFPNDYTSVRSGGKNGDMKNDGYCPKSRTFFQAYGTLGKKIANVKNKIEEDLKGCLEKQSDVKKWVFLTNYTNTGEVEKFIDDLRKNYSQIEIDVWDHKKIASIIEENFKNKKDVSFIIGINVDKENNNYINYEANEKQDIEIINEIFSDVLNKIKEGVGSDYKFKESIIFNQKIILNFANKEEQEEVRRYFLDAIRKIKLINQRMSEEDSEIQKDIHSHFFSLYSNLKREGESNINILHFLVNEIIPQSKKNDLAFEHLCRALILSLFEDCTIFERTDNEKAIVIL